jgi:hypothetical protein
VIYNCYSDCSNSCDTIKGTITEEQTTFLIDQRMLIDLSLLTILCYFLTSLTHLFERCILILEKAGFFVWKNNLHKRYHELLNYFNEQSIKVLNFCGNVYINEGNRPRIGNFSIVLQWQRREKILHQTWDFGCSLKIPFLSICIKGNHDWNKLMKKMFVSPS